MSDSIFILVFEVRDELDGSRYCKGSWLMSTFFASLLCSYSTSFADSILSILFFMTTGAQAIRVLLRLGVDVTVRGDEQGPYPGLTAYQVRVVRCQFSVP